MTKIKYIIFSILILIALIIPGELYQSYIGQNSKFYETSFYLQDGDTAQKMLSDIQNTAKSHNVSIFVQDIQVKNMFTCEVNIYCDDIVKQILSSEYSIKSGKYKSIFSGNTTVNFYDFMDVPDTLLEYETSLFQLLGNYDDMVKMKQDLISLYGGKFPKIDSYNILTDMKRTILGIWSLITLIICFLSFYFLTLFQRELMVRSTMGEHPFKLYLKIIFFDSIFLILFFSISTFLLSYITNVLFLFNLSIIMLGVCILCNCIVNARIFSFKIREAFNKVAGRFELTMGTYIIKAISCSFSVIIITFQLVTIKESLDFYRQRSFFEEHKSYNYIRVWSKYNYEDIIVEQLYRTYNDKISILDPNFSYEDYSIYDEYSNTVILANKSTYKYLCEWIPELKNQKITGEACLIMNDKKIISEEGINFIKECAYELCLSDSDFFNLQVIKYKKSSSIISVEEDFINKSSWLKNPSILLTMKDKYPVLNKNEILKGNHPVELSFRGYNFMINVPEQELMDFVATYNCEAKITNAYDYYLYRWEIMKRSLYLSVVFIFMILILEIYINILIIKLEYNFNSMQLSIMKITGYSRFERIRKLCIISLIMMFLSTVVCLISLTLLKQFGIIFPIISVFIVGILDFGVIKLFSIDYEKKNIPRILKGGNV